MNKTFAEKAREIARLALPTVENLKEKACWEKIESTILAAAKRGEFSCLIDMDEINRSMSHPTFAKGLRDRGLACYSEIKESLTGGYYYEIFW